MGTCQSKKSTSAQEYYPKPDIDEDRDSPKTRREINGNKPRGGAISSDDDSGTDELDSPPRKGKNKTHGRDSSEEDSDADSLKPTRGRGKPGRTGSMEDLSKRRGVGRARARTTSLGSEGNTTNKNAKAAPGKGRGAKPRAGSKNLLGDLPKIGTSNRYGIARDQGGGSDPMLNKRNKLTNGKKTSLYGSDDRLSGLYGNTKGKYGRSGGSGEEDLRKKKTKRTNSSEDTASESEASNSEEDKFSSMRQNSYGRNNRNLRLSEEDKYGGKKVNFKAPGRGQVSNDDNKRFPRARAYGGKTYERKEDSPPLRRTLGRSGASFGDSDEDDPVKTRKSLGRSGGAYGSSDEDLGASKRVKSYDRRGRVSDDNSDDDDDDRRRKPMSYGRSSGGAYGESSDEEKNSFRKTNSYSTSYGRKNAKDSSDEDRSTKGRNRSRFDPTESEESSSEDDKPEASSKSRGRNYGANHYSSDEDDKPKASRVSAGRSYGANRYSSDEDDKPVASRKSLGRSYGASRGSSEEDSPPAYSARGSYNSSRPYSYTDGRNRFTNFTM